LILKIFSKIRVQKRRGKEFDRKLNSWPFYQLEQFIRYKAATVGKHVLTVDARYTSSESALTVGIPTSGTAKVLRSDAESVAFNSMLTSTLIEVLLGSYSLPE